MNKLSLVLIIMGIIIIIFPVIGDLREKQRQQQLVDEFYMQNSDPSALLESYRQGNDILNTHTEENASLHYSIEENNDADQSNRSSDEKSKNPPAKPQVRGILVINKINLRLPIFYGTSQRELAMGVGLVKGTAKIGEMGNMVLAGHRGRSFGRLLNRLNELVSGDVIVVDSGSKNYVYSVYEKEVVYPEDTHVLYGPKDQRTLTLITCHPLHQTSHRLVIKARLID